MIDWKKFFQNYRIIDIYGNEDLLFQVGTTVGGKPISFEQFNAIVHSIHDCLKLDKNDYLLDLCCGNGVITYELARITKYVLGIDSSEPYIQNAQIHKKSAHIDYAVCDITDSDQILKIAQGKKFNKISLYASLAYFTPSDLRNILAYLGKIGGSNIEFMIGSILDRDKKWSFFNTFNRRCHYLLHYVIMRSDMGLGRWWTKREITRIADENGFTCIFFEQPPMLHTAHYRFDVVLRKN